MPSAARAGWDPDLEAVTWSAGTGPGTLALSLRCVDVSCAELTSVRLTIPVQPDGAIRTLQVGMAPAIPLRWRSLAVGATAAGPVQDGLHEMSVRRTSARSWRLRISPAASAADPGQRAISAVIELTVPRASLPWRSVDIALQASRGGAQGAGIWRLSPTQG
ncbi:MAG TPA: hypothetical protein VNA30_01760 [Mycobacteriales bacterium]|nr:hypothetical protein [Mycobacteriales bacterium]